MDRILDNKESSYNKIMALDGTFKENTQQWYIDAVKEGKYTFLADNGVNWDFYKDEKDNVYSIAKEKGCKSSCFGDMKYYGKRIKSRDRL